MVNHLFVNEKGLFGRGKREIVRTCLERNSFTYFHVPSHARALLRSRGGKSEMGGKMVGRWKGMMQS
jgi:hypothetical protein